MPAPCSFVPIIYILKRGFLFEIWHLHPLLFSAHYILLFIPPVQAAGPQVYPTGSGEGPEIPWDNGCLLCDTCMQSRHTSINGSHASFCHFVKMMRIRIRLICLGDQIGENDESQMTVLSSLPLLLEHYWLVKIRLCKNLWCKFGAISSVSVNYTATEQLHLSLRHWIERL